MKTTDNDIELALKFPAEATVWGFGKTMAEAKLSPKDLQRLLDLKLIKPSRTNNAAPSPTAKQGVGAFFRRTDSYIRTFDKKENAPISRK
jgi:hypothetical protein